MNKKETEEENLVYMMASMAHWSYEIQKTAQIIHDTAQTLHEKSKFVQKKPKYYTK